MKKLILSLLFSVAVIAVNAQFVVEGTNTKVIQLSGNSVSNIDAVFLFNGISADNMIKYTGSGSSFSWTKYDGTFMSNQPDIAIEDATGYILTVDGDTQYYIWVIDYNNALITANSLTVEAGGSNECNYLGIRFDGSIPNLVYFDKNGSMQTLIRRFTLTYQDAQYSNNQWGNVTRTVTQTAPFTTISVSAPLKDTQFTLTGDQYATQLSATPITLTTATYSAIRTKANLNGVIESRNVPNEINVPGAGLQGSGPLTVNFTSNANAVTQFYDWVISPINGQGATMRYTDTDIRYTFQQTGTYRVVLTTYGPNQTCSYTDSTTVTVSESYIEAPNVFTPNGDGNNDEFRVAYKSIAKYAINIYSTWAGKVYSSNDPSTGWNGRVNGKLVPPGAYYYIITATGTDGKKYKLKGSVSVLHSKNDK